jgi:zinc finger FYVE domain-containing protein 26
MACLKAGNLTAAREKFSRCLKPPFDLNQLSHGSRLVQDVVEYLESTARPLVSLVRTKQQSAWLWEEARNSKD